MRELAATTLAGEPMIITPASLCVPPFEHPERDADQGVSIPAE
jgi:hypothetical protein